MFLVTAADAAGDCDWLVASDQWRVCSLLMRAVDPLDCDYYYHYHYYYYYYYLLYSL